MTDTLSSTYNYPLPGPLIEWFKEKGLPPCTGTQLRQPSFFQVHILRLCHSLSAGQRPVPALSNILPGPEKVTFNWDIVFRGLGAIGFTLTRERQDKLRDTNHPSGIFEDLAVEMHKWWSLREQVAMSHASSMATVQSRKAVTAMCLCIVKDMVSTASDRAIGVLTEAVIKPVRLRQATVPRTITMQNKYHANLVASEIVQGIVECALRGLTAPGDLEKYIAENPALKPIDAHHRRMNIEKSIVSKQKEHERESRNIRFKATQEEVREMLVQLRAEKEEKDRKMLEDLRQQEAKLREILSKHRTKDADIKQQQRAALDEFKQRQQQEAAVQRQQEIDSAEKQRQQNEERVKQFNLKKQKEREQREDLAKRAAVVTPVDAAGQVLRKMPVTGGKSSGWLTSAEEELLLTLYEVLRNGKTFGPLCAYEGTRAFLQTVPRFDALDVPEISPGLTFAATHLAWLLPHSRLTSHDVTSVLKNYGRCDRSKCRTELLAILPPNPPSARHIVAALLADPSHQKMLWDQSPTHTHVSVCLECTTNFTVVVILSCTKFATTKSIPQLMDLFQLALPDGPQALANLVLEPSRLDVTSWKETARNGVVKMKEEAPKITGQYSSKKNDSSMGMWREPVAVNTSSERTPSATAVGGMNSSSCTPERDPTLLSTFRTEGHAQEDEPRLVQSM